MRNYKYIALLSAVILFAPSCRKCDETRGRSEVFLGPDYWPLYGRWELRGLSSGASETALGPESGYMHGITWYADGTFVVERINEVIEVGHIEKVISVNILEDNYFHIAVLLKSDCPKKAPWFTGQHSITASGDINSGQRSLSMSSYSFPWGTDHVIKGLGYDQL